jgi:hypothetical protein
VCKNCANIFFGLLDIVHTRPVCRNRIRALANKIELCLFFFFYHSFVAFSKIETAVAEIGNRQLDVLEKSKKAGFKNLFMKNI